AAARYAFLGELLWKHMQVAEANVLVGRVHEQVDRHLAGRAQHHGVAHRHHVVLIGLAAAALEALLARTRADVLSLVAETAGALADVEIAVLAEIVAPRIGVITSGAFILEQSRAADAAAIG